MVPREQPLRPANAVRTHHPHRRQSFASQPRYRRPVHSQGQGKVGKFPAHLPSHANPTWEQTGHRLAPELPATTFEDRAESAAVSNSAGRRRHWSLGTQVLSAELARLTELY